MLPNIAAYNVTVGPHAGRRNTLRDFICQRSFTGRSGNLENFRCAVEYSTTTVVIVEMGFEARGVKHGCAG